MTTRDALRAQTCAQLRAQLAERGMSRAGRKALLVERLFVCLYEEETILDDVAQLEAMDAALNDDVEEEEEEEEEEAAGDDTAPAADGAADGTRRGVAMALLAAAVSAAALYRYFASMPPLAPCAGLSPAWLVRTGLSRSAAFAAAFGPAEDTLESGLTKLQSCAEALGNESGNSVVVGYAGSYMFFQAFAVPGPNLLLSIFAGALFQNVLAATVIVASSCTAGAVCCYLLSSAFLEGALRRAIPARIAAFRARVEDNREALFFYMLFLRLTPLLPNWFINMVSPIVGVPVSTFALATLLGQMPMNYLSWNCGKTFFDAVAGSAGSISLQLVGGKMVAAVAALGVASLLPVLLKSRLAEMEASMGKKKTKKKATTQSKQTAAAEKSGRTARAAKRKASSGKVTRSSSRGRKKKGSSKYTRTTTLVAGLRDHDDAPVVLRPRSRRSRRR